LLPLKNTVTPEPNSAKSLLLPSQHGSNLPRRAPQ
jgi:hypothetical protein